MIPFLPAPKWTREGFRWSADGLTLLDRFGRVAYAFPVPPAPKPEPIRASLWAGIPTFR